MITAEDRLALILGRAIIRAEALAAELEQSKARLEEHELDREKEGQRDDA